MAKAKTRAANLAVPQSREQAAEFLAQIGKCQREIARVEGDMNDRIAAVKTEAVQAVQPIQVRMGALTEGLRIWCDANREALTDKGRVKFADLGTGVVLWRVAPPKVSLSGVETVIDALRTLGLGRFLRTKVEVDKEAMLAEPDAARLVPGVKIGSAGEDFACKPFETSVGDVLAGVAMEAA